MVVSSSPWCTSPQVAQRIRFDRPGLMLGTARKRDPLWRRTVVMALLSVELQ